MEKEKKNEKKTQDTKKKKTKKKKEKEEEEEKYNKTKLSMLGRSVCEPIVQEMSKLRWENVQNQQTCLYSHRNLSKSEEIHVDIPRILKTKDFS